MKRHTDITMILDRSGSMNDCKSAMEEALNAYLTDQKRVDEPCTFSLVRFDNEYVVSQNCVSIQEVNKICIEPRGSTALLDAIGRAITDTGRRLEKLPEQERPDKILFVIVTDGIENSSRTYVNYNPRLGPKAQTVFDMIKHQNEKYGWTFVFLGANQDAIATATALGISADNALNFDASNSGRNRFGSNFAGKALSSATKLLRESEEKTCGSLFRTANANPNQLDTEYTSAFRGLGALDDEDVKRATTEQK